MARPAENPRYQLEDHVFRGADEYANTKYDITIDWLGLGGGARAGRTLANVGCGSGEFNARAASLGLRVVACEPDHAAFELAAEAGRGLAALELCRFGLLELARRTPPVDLLVMHDVLEHLADERAAVDALGALVKPGGEAVLSVPALPWLYGLHDEALGHHRRYTRARLLSLFEEGWTVRRSRYFGSLFVPVTLWYSRLARRPYPTGAFGSVPWKRAALRAACRLQRALPEPIGTSLLVHVVRRGGR